MFVFLNAVEQMAISATKLIRLQSYPMQVKLFKKRNFVLFGLINKMLLLAALCVACIKMSAQSIGQLEDTLKNIQQQPGYQSKNTTVDLLNKLSNKYVYNNPDSAMFFGNKALQMANSQQYIIGQGRAMSNIGKAYYVKGSYDSSLNFSDGALRIAEKQKDSLGICMALNNIGLIYLAHEEMQAAIKEFNKALVFAEALHNNLQQAINLFDIGICYDETKELDKAVDYLNKAIEIDKPNDDHHITVMAYNRMGKTLFYSKKNKEAIEWYEKVINYSAYRDNWELTFAYSGLAETYYDMGQYNDAITNALQSFSFAKKMNAKWDAEQALKILSKSYAAAGDFKNAYQYQVLDGLYNDSLYNEAKDQVVNYLRLQQKEAVNAGLQKQNELNLQKIHLTRLLNIWISVFALALVATLILLYRSYKAKTALNLQLVEKNKNIENLNRMKDQLFAVVSHDLRGPMSSLQQTLQLINEGVLSEDQQKYLLETLLRQVTVSGQMLNNLLTWAATQRNGISAQLEKTNAGEIIKEILAVFEVLAGKKNITIAYDNANEQPLLADHNQLRIILQNLLSNAIKFTPQDGTIRIYYTRDDKKITIHIHDSGIGISEEKQKRLFKNFGSVISTFGTDKEKGAGIGLLIVKEFTDQNNGHLSITSEEGKGTTFSITFPMFLAS